MKLRNAEKIAKKLNDDGAEGVSVHKHYSWRGAFGKSTAGVACPDPVACGRVMGELGIEDSMRHETLGMGVIVF